MEIPRKKRTLEKVEKYLKRQGFLWNFIEKAIKLFLVIFKHREDVKNVSSLFSALVIKIAQPLLIGSGWWNQSCFDYLICPLISDWALD